MYQFSDRVRYSEMDENGRMTIPAVMDLFQDCSDYQSEALGIGQEFLAGRHRAWMLSFWQVFFERYPENRETFVAETRPWKFEHFLGYRNFALYDAAGKPMVKANSLWTMLDTQRMRPVRPAEDEKSPYGMDEPLEMTYADTRKISLPEQMAEKDPVPVRRAHLDMNHHVNNVQYIQMAAEYFSMEKPVYELRAEYRTAALPGDTIFPRMGEKDGWQVVSLEKEDGTIFAVVAVRGKEE